MQYILLTTITPTRQNQSLFSSDSKVMDSIDDTIITAILKYGGHSFTTHPHHYFASFTNDFPLKCAKEIFDQLLELIGSKNIRAIRISMGTGPSVSIESYIIGSAVAQAQRLNTICPGGQILLPKSAYETLPTFMNSNVMDYGSPLLTDLLIPDHIFGTTSSAILNPGHITEKRITAPTNLPLYETPLTGRESELNVLRNMLLDNRVLSITGPAGVGKTRLSHHLGAQCHKIFSDGVFYIDFNDQIDLQEHLFTLATHLNITLHSASGIDAQIITHLHTKKILLMADCGTQFLSHHHEFLTTLIKNTSSLQLLLVTRAPVGIIYEQVFTLGNLPTPKQDAPLVEHLFGESSFLLYLNHALYMYPDLLLDNNTVKMIINICTLLQGTPQAILMAAAWSKTLTVNQLNETLARLIPEFEKHDQTIPGLPKRNNALRAMFEATLQDLKRDEYDAFIKLSIFKNSFNVYDAQKATGVQALTVARLFNKSPLIKTSSELYTMEKVFKRIAYEELLASDFMNSVHLSFYHYYLEVLNKNLPKIHSSHQQNILLYFNQNKENIISAWHLCLNNGSLAEIVLFMNALFEPLDRLHAYAEIIILFDALRTILDEETLMQSPDVISCKAQLHSIFGSCYTHLHSSEEAEAALIRSLSLSTELLESSRSTIDGQDIENNQAVTLLRMSILKIQLNKKEEALTHAQKALKVFVTKQNSTAHAWAEGVIGLIFLQMDLCEKSTNHFKESLVQYQYSNYPAGIKWAQHNLARSLYNSGNFSEAQKYSSISEFESESTTDPHDLTLYNSTHEELTIEKLETLVSIYHQVGDYQKALSNAEKLLILSSNIGNNKVIGDTLLSMGMIHCSLGNVKKSKSQLDEALTLFEKMKHHQEINHTYLNLASLQWQSDKLTLMGDYLNKIDTELIPPQSTFTVDYYNILGTHALLTENLINAEESFTKAHTMSVHLNYENGMMRAINNLSKLALTSKDITEALNRFHTLLPIANKSGTYPIILESLLDLSQILIDTKEYEFAMDTLIFIHNHKATNGFVKKHAKKKLFKMPPKYGKQFFFYCINNEEHRNIEEFCSAIVSHIEIALSHQSGSPSL
ncbi:MAG: hypothetical protein OCD01_06885 [Fibrobacterales bacterium]